MVNNLKNNTSLKVNLLLSQSRWSKREKLRRLAWMPFDFLLFWKGPRLLSKARVWALRLFGAKIGQRVLILGGVKVWCPWNLEIGDFSAIGFDVEIYNFAKVTIGEHTVISQYVYICTASHDYKFIDMPLFFTPIFIGSQVWIAARSFIAPGISIGEGCVVGAYSIVTKDVLGWSVVAGNPATLIRTRTLEIYEQKVE